MFQAIKALTASTLYSSDVMTPEDYKFMEYITEYGKSYGTVAEFQFRLTQFKQRHADIEAFNADKNNTHKVGHNEFSDMTYAEMKKRNGYKHKEATKVTQLDASSNAASIDWRDQGAVTPVKNQGQCGSCWAFSTTGAVEGTYFLKAGYLQSFSEQQLVDCAGGHYLNHGCEGGLMDYAFYYVEKNPLMLEADYPYTALDGPTCKVEPTKEYGNIAGWTDVDKSIDQLKAALNKSPVSIAIEAD